MSARERLSLRLHARLMEEFDMKDMERRGGFEQSPHMSAIVDTVMETLDEFIEENAPEPKSSSFDWRKLKHGDRVRINPALTEGDGSATDANWTVTQVMEDELRASDGWGTVKTNVIPVGGEDGDEEILRVELDDGKQWNWHPADIIEVDPDLDI